LLLAVVGGKIVPRPAAAEHQQQKSRYHPFHITSLRGSGSNLARKTEDQTPSLSYRTFAPVRPSCQGQALEDVFPNPNLNPNPNLLLPIESQEIKIRIKIKIRIRGRNG
jgi:hypothetical protein